MKHSIQDARRIFSMRLNRRSRKGFTLLEILLVVAAIGILAGIVIIAINPTKQLGDTRNAQRRADVNTIMNGIYQFAVDTNGSFPPLAGAGQIPSIAGAVCPAVAPGSEICQTGVTQAICGTANLVYLGDLTAAGKYLVAIPKDPKAVTVNGVGYHVVQDSTTKRLIVCAPLAENSPSTPISITR